MTTASFEIAYDGDALKDHVMDVQQLAPALLALGNLIRDTNAAINADASRVRVLVKSDFEHKCFNVGFDVVQTVFEQARTFLEHKDVKTAKDILGILGLIGVPSVGTVFGYLIWRKGRKVDTERSFTDVSGTGVVQLQLQDGSKAEIHQHIYSLAEKPEIKKAVAGIVAPIQNAGIDKVEFREKGSHAPSVTVGKDDADSIRASCESDPTDAEIAHPPQPVTAHLRVRSPVFDPEAKQWRFFYGEEIISADISETNIAANAIARGGVMIDDLYTVKLEITEHETGKGRFRKSYKVLEVLDFRPAPRQTSLFGPSR
jgi:hypothetical protein